MSRDNWEKLVQATLKKEELRQLALCPSISSSMSDDFNSRFSIDSNGTGNAISFSHNVRGISYKELKRATRNFQFDFHFGEGGFGTVFKGWIHEDTLTAAKPGSGVLVAIKNWNPSHEDWKEELNCLSRVQHPNLIRLIGYCSNEDNLFSVFEFAMKGSLENHLFRRGHQSLSWATRIKVAIGAARALSFLHDMETQVTHRGFKTADILLDDEFNAKLSGCVLAKDGVPSDSFHMSTRVTDTEGYVAPEYVMTIVSKKIFLLFSTLAFQRAQGLLWIHFDLNYKGHLTAKSDVYDFGVVLLELLSGRRVLDMTKAANEQNLAEWAKSHNHDKRNLNQIMDPKLEGQYPVDGAYCVATLALQCLSPNPELRLQMSEVLVALEHL
ncbi:hypothetical protein RD792_008433 [Penstemon davidsonii]|uniref:Protein kinase domain-containing protein n=1 Tax=Penstemon davidsonii TaxID=160366 RepID=A0ABR0DAC5_9LAMI|nr:hypothetical protein RD792_008433 [Penstemon davidsonii]